MNVSWVMEFESDPKKAALNFKPDDVKRALRSLIQAMPK